MSAEIHDLHNGRSRPSAGLPHNIEAEQALLGAIMINNEAFGRVSGFLKPEHFSEELHRRIFDVASQLIRAGKVATPITLKTFLGDADLGGVTIPQYLARLAAEATAIINTEDYGRTIYDLATRRDLLGISERLTKLAQDPPVAMTCAEVAATSLEELQVIAERAVASGTRRDPAECGQVLLDKARKIMRGEVSTIAVSTGLSDLDRSTGGGFRPGTLWIVAGRPRMGKTVLATGFAKKAAMRSLRDMEAGQAGVGVALFSLEVEQDELTARLLADIGFNARQQIGFGAILAGDLDEERLATVERAQEVLGALPLCIDVADRLSVAEITSRIRAEKARMARRGIQLAVCFIDYLKQIKSTDRYAGSRVYEIAEISGGLKALAKREGICIVLLAQLNRGVEQKDRKDKTPGLADLRESGDLEADADVVLIVDRESVRLKHSPEYKAGDPEAIDRFQRLEHRAELIVAKTRVGSERTIDCWFHAACSTFGSASREVLP